MVLKSLLRMTVVAAGVAAAGAGLLLAGPAVSSAAAVAVPGGFQVVRQGGDLQTLAISWKPVAGAARYTVTVFDGKDQKAWDVPASTTSYAYTGSGVCTRYKVMVTAYDAAGAQAATNVYLVNPLAPGGITNLTLNRSSDGAATTVSWAPAPAGSSYKPATSYRVQMRDLTTGSVVSTRDSAATTERTSGLNADRAYAAEILPTNQFGSCAPSKVLIRGSRPSAPTAVKVIRDGNDKQTAHITWNSPAWTGYGKESKIQVGVRNGSMRNPNWIDLPAGATSADLKLPNDKHWSVWVRAVNGTMVGEFSKEYAIEQGNTPGQAAVDSQVHITEDSGIVHVKFDGPVGSSAAYPRMNVAITGTTTDAGYTESQEAFNRAQTFTFDHVPCGAYTVSVTGFGAGSSKEFGRLMINRCNTGAVTANQWKLVVGQATITGNAVDHIFGGEARTISTLPRTSPDMVYATDATLRTGRGYGIWTRAAVNKYGAIDSGYTFQYDPGYQYVDSKFGKALLLRVWNYGNECSTPLAKVKWPAGLSENAAHHIVVVTKGDTLYATIDGIKMFDVPSLSQALAASKCTMTAPTGSQVGFRTWGDAQATFRNTTIN